jgi:hypothetical protein
MRDADVARTAGAATSEASARSAAAAAASAPAAGKRDEAPAVHRLVGMSCFPKPIGNMQASLHGHRRPLLDPPGTLPASAEASSSVDTSGTASCPVAAMPRSSSACRSMGPRTEPQMHACAGATMVGVEGRRWGAGAGEHSLRPSSCLWRRLPFPVITPGERSGNAPATSSFATAVTCARAMLSASPLHAAATACQAPPPLPCMAPLSPRASWPVASCCACDGCRSAIRRQYSGGAASKHTKA